MTILQKNLTNKISIELIGSPINGKGMNVTIDINGTKFDQILNLSGKHQIEFYHSYPMVIKLTVSGKGPSDTQIDADGRIIQDKHVLVSTVHISGISVKKWMLEKYVIEFDNRRTNYLGTNGTATIHLPKLDAIENHLYLLAKSSTA